MSRLGTAGAGLAGATGEFAESVRFEDLPAEVVSTLELCLDFNLGIGRAGFPELDGLGRSFAASEPGGAATVWVAGERGAPDRVAFANAMAAHARAQDDFQHSAHCHIGAVTIPAAIALAESRRLGGRELLAALAVGYQVSSVLGSLTAWGTSAKGLRATPLYGPLGGAAACAKLLGLDAEGIASAISLAANMAVGFNHAWTEGTLEWRTQVGHASRVSIECAELAELGATAGPTTLEAGFGFFQVHAGRAVEPEEVAEALPRWRLADMQMKPRPVCGINQGPVASAAELASRADLDPARIRSVRLRMRPEDLAYPGITGKGPFNGPGTALMSTPFAVSTALLEGDVAFAALTPPYREDVLDLVARTELEVDEGLPELGHVLTVVDEDGAEHVREYLEPMELGALRRDVIDEVLARVGAEVGDDRVPDPRRRRAVEALAAEDAPVPDLVAVL